MRILFWLSAYLLSSAVFAQVVITGSYSGSTLVGSGGPITVFPSSSVTVEQTAVVPFQCTNGATNSGAWSLVSGVGSVSSSGNYTAPASNGSAVVRCTISNAHADIAVTVSGTIPAASGCTGYPNHGTATQNTCTMTHTEKVGTATRKWQVMVPTNYVSGQSALIVNVGGGGHGLTGTGDACGAPGSEVAGWAYYANSVSSPSPVVVCPEGDFNTASTERWNYIGLEQNPTWLDGSVPNDPDFIRQLILLTVRDLSLNPRKVFMTCDWMSDHFACPMAEEAAIRNSDLVAAVGLYNESNLTGLDSTFTAAYTGGINLGQTLPYPTVPISVVMEPGLTNGVGTAGYRGQMCGTNKLTTNNFYHPLTADDSFTFFDHADQTTSTTYFPNNVGNSFCNGTFDNNGSGQPSSLQARKSLGGILGTDIVAYRFVGNNVPSPWCSFDASGADTLGCSNGTTGSRMALDLSVLSPCDFTHPCNAYVDSSTGIDPIGLQYKFFAGHAKP